MRDTFVASSSKMRDGTCNVINCGPAPIQLDPADTFVSSHHSIGETVPKGMDVLEVKMPIADLGFRKIKHSNEAARRQIENDIVGEKIAVNEYTILRTHYEGRVKVKDIADRSGESRMVNPALGQRAQLPGRIRRIFGSRFD
jgi:hypothetical protein